jgi:hypothetical protein
LNIEQERRRIRNKEEYFKEFPEHVRAEALKNILDIRKFEIELYWKRAAYFWAFIGAVFVGYFALLSAPKPTGLHHRGQFILITLGVMFSLCWYLVNRGSKFWQQNWETHLDVMEDGLIGPLYKTTIPEDYDKGKWCCPTLASPFSVSKINILLSFFILILWILIDINFMYNKLYQVFPGLYWYDFFQHLNLFLQLEWWNVYTFLLSFQIISTFFLILRGRTGKGHNDPFRTHIFFDQRGFSEEAPIIPEDCPITPGRGCFKYCFEIRQGHIHSYIRNLCKYRSRDCV